MDKLTTEQSSNEKRVCPKGCGPLEPYAEADIGVGVQQFGPWGCPVCHWVEPRCTCADFDGFVDCPVHI